MAEISTYCALMCQALAYTLRWIISGNVENNPIWNFHLHFTGKGNEWGTGQLGNLSEVRWAVKWRSRNLYSSHWAPESALPATCYALHSCTCTATGHVTRTVQSCRFQSPTGSVQLLCMGGRAPVSRRHETQRGPVVRCLILCCLRHTMLQRSTFTHHWII